MFRFKLLPDVSAQRRRQITAWCFFDWANSAFTTLVVTFIYATYFTKALASDEVTGPVLWSRAITATGLVVALLSPLLGAYADTRGLRRRFLWLTTLSCAAATAALTFISPETQNAVLLALVTFTLANVAFELQMVFYNAYLPELAPANRTGAVSGYGWGLGYIGGLACMIAALWGFLGETPALGLPQAGGFNVRATNLLVSAWLLIFGLPFLLMAPPGTQRRQPVAGLRAQLRQLHTMLRARPEVARFLLARIFYNDGLVTIFAFGGIFASTAFGMQPSEILVFGIVLNIAAGVGALSFGYIDDRFGSWPTIMASLVALGMAVFAVALAKTELWLWAAGVVIGLFAGPNQSASRSLMSRLAPADRHGEYFGLFALSGKLTAFLGPLMLGLVTDWFGDLRAGVGVIALFFLVGGVLMVRVPRI